MKKKDFKLKVIGPSSTMFSTSDSKGVRYFGKLVVTCFYRVMNDIQARSRLTRCHLSDHLPPVEYRVTVTLTRVGNSLGLTNLVL